MINVTILALLLVGCTTEAPDAPNVALVADPVPAPTAWESLGYTFDPAADLPECDLHWRANTEPPCQITIGVVRVPMLRERAGTNARTFRDQRRIEIDSRLEGYALELAVAHEVGHILLDTPEHTQTGIMSGSSLVLSADDRALACRTVGLGC